MNQTRSFIALPQTVHTESVSFPGYTTDTVPVEVHEALKTAMEKLQVSN